MAHISEDFDVVLNNVREIQQSPSKEEWIKDKRYATHNLPQHMRDYLKYQGKMSFSILTRGYFEKMASSWS